MIVGAIAAGGGLVMGLVLIAGMAGGAQYAAVASDPAQMSHAVCGYETKNEGITLGLSARQADNAKAIVEVAIKLNLPQRAAEIALATALQESRLDNGAVSKEGKSFGLFQQTPSAGWGTREQVTTPSYAARSFYKRLIQVRGWTTMPLTKAAAIVQRPQRNLRGEYAKHEALAKGLVDTLWLDAKGLTDEEQSQVQTSIEAAASLGVPREAVVTDLVSGLRQKYGTQRDPAAVRKQAEDIVRTIADKLCTKLDGLSAAAGSARAVIAVTAALAQRGIAYSWGGGGPAGPSFGIGRGANTKGFDCSGLTEYAWSKAGARIGGTTYEQVNSGQKILRSQIQPGDLVFYETDSSRPGPDHVGLAVSGAEMVNAPHTGAVVRVDRIDRRGYAGAVRPS